MIKVFIGDVLADIPCTELLFPNLGNKEWGNPFGEKVFGNFTKPIVEIVKKPEDSEYFLLPHNFNHVKDNSQYLTNFIEWANDFKKQIIVFFPGDSDQEVPIPNSIVFRNSQYASKKRLNEIIMPAYAVDMSRGEVSYKNKSQISTVGFCGWAKPSSFKGWLQYFYSHYKVTARTQGLYFRIKALKALEKSNDIVCNFIIRSSYSGNTKTLTVDPEIARREYIQNMKDSDFILAPKGDGNFSVRFYEALSLGRIPVLIDTDCYLPLEDEIDYSKFIVRVDYTEIKNLPKIISEFYASLSESQFTEMQKMAKQAFDRCLRIDVFFRHVFSGDNLKKYGNLG